jgi:hypothetical protein
MKRADLATGFLGILLASSIAASQWLSLEPRADDPAFLGWAADNQPTSPDWSPILVKLFRFSYLAASNSQLDAYRLSTSLLTISLWVIIFIFLSLSSGSRLLAFLSATIFTISGFTPAAASKEIHFIIVSSIAGHLTLAFVLLAMLSVYLENSLRSLALAAILLAFATYSRPEMLLAAIVGLAMVLRRAIRERAWRDWPYFVIALSPLAVWAFLAWQWGVPTLSPARSWLAFGQHAGLSFCSVYPAKCHADVWGGWRASVEEIFPGSTSIGSTARLHPVAFAEHVLRNAILSVLNILTATFDFAGRPSGYLPTALVALVAAGSLALLRRLGPTTPAGQTSKPLLVIVLAAAAPQMVNWLLLYPRQHYVVVPVVTISILVSCYAFERSRKRRELLPSSPVP